MNVASRPTHGFGSQLLQASFHLGGAGLCGAPQDMRDALTANARVRRRPGRIHQANDHAPRIDRHHAGCHPPQHRVRAATLVRYTGQHFDLAVFGKPHDHRRSARADVAYSESDTPTASRCKWCLPSRFALQRLQDFHRTREMDLLTRHAGFAIAQRVAAPQLDGIDAKLAGDHVDVALTGKHRLRITGSAHGSAGNAVGIDGLYLQLRHRNVVRRERIVSRHDQRRPHLTCRVRSAVDDRFALMGQKLAVTTHGGAQVHNGRMP